MDKAALIERVQEIANSIASQAEIDLPEADPVGPLEDISNDCDRLSVLINNYLAEKE